MLTGHKGTKPVVLYIALAIILLSLALTFVWSRHVRTASPPTVPVHDGK
jgi:hypothetical protein